ncbi:imelysin family protein [Ketobacter sp.]|uniref:imelysin family protein n=1 Tax=Ketobacter sp. TaxID=2083498 RepID=UPI0025BBAA68|nr:imelysin family protein [Ketobacter sp.]
MARRILLLTMLWLLLGSCERTSPEEKWITALSARIEAGYQSLHSSSRDLNRQVQEFCVQNTDINVPRQQWRQTMAAWQDIQWVRFGPIVEHNDDWKIQFWPDKKNIVARKVNKMLNEPQSITVEGVANASVVVQGLSAVELLLFDEPYVTQFTSTGTQSGDQCQLLTAITTTLAANTGRIVQAWQDAQFQAGWLASVGQPQDGVHANAVSDAVGAMLTQMEKVKVDKLGGPLGYKNRNRQPNGYFSEGWRSDSSLDNIKINLLAMQGIMQNNEAYDLRRLLESKGNAVIADEFQARLNDNLALLATIDKPLREAVMEPGYRQQLEDLYQSLGALNSLIKTKLTKALGINLGFNSNDGD